MSEEKSEGQKTLERIDATLGEIKGLLVTTDSDENVVSRFDTIGEEIKKLTVTPEPAPTPSAPDDPPKKKGGLQSFVDSLFE